jgi:hypothetical protein
MTSRIQKGIACAIALLASSFSAWADLAANSEGVSALVPVRESAEKGGPVPKAAGVQVLGSRATVDAIGPMYGGFYLTATTDVYILVRGNSLGTLGITQAYLDGPRVRVYNSAGTDLIFDSLGNPGFNACSSTGQFSAPVHTLYTNRGEPPHLRDACTAHSFPAGGYSFTVNPTPGQSAPSLGEVLFEVSFNP